MPGPEGRADDRALVERAARGDREAFGVLVQRHQDRVFNLAYQVVRNREDALDVAQEAFVKAFASLSSFKGEASFTTWMHRIVVNLAIDCLRRRRRGDPTAYDDRLAVPEDGERAWRHPTTPAAAVESRQVRSLLGSRNPGASAGASGGAGPARDRGVELRRDRASRRLQPRDRDVAALLCAEKTPKGARTAPGRSAVSRCQRIT